MKLFWLTLILSIILRFYRLEQFAGFSWDQEQLLAYPVKNILSGDLTLIGPQTGPGNIYLGPLLYYLAVPFFWIFRLHPITGSVLASTLGVSTAIGVYLVFKKFFTQNVGLVALALYATSPLFNLNDRTIWNPSLIPLASLGVLAAYLSWWKYHKATYVNLIVLATATALGIQAHLGFIFILPLHLLIWLKFKPSLSWPKIGWFFLVVIGWFLPLIAFDLRHQGINITNLLNFLLSGSTQFNLAAITQKWFEMVRSSLGLIGSILIYAHVPHLNVLAGLVILLAGLWWRHYLFIAYLVIFSLGFSFYSGNIPDYYLWPMLLPAVLMVSLTCQQLGLRFKFSLPALVAIILFWLSFKTLDELSLTPPDSLEHKFQAVQYIISRSGGKPFRVVYDTDFGRYYGFGYLFDYYKITPSANPQDPAFTIVIPEFFRTGTRSDVAFGSIGIINPKELSR